VNTFGDRGEALWAALGQVASTPAGVLAVEACRIADRLDALAGDPESWVEARLQAAQLKALLESPLLKVAEPKGASGVDDVAARRAARRAAAQGASGS
jgi:hypothetical protein